MTDISLGDLIKSGVEARKDNRRGDAQDIFTQAVAAFPDDLKARLELAVEFRHCDRFAEAAALLETILATEPEHRAALRNLAACCRRLENRERALELLSHLHRLEPDSPAIAHEYASELLAARRHPEARKVYRNVLEQDPSYPPALKGMAYCARQAGDHNQSAGWFQKALDQDPASEQLWLSVADDYLRSGQLDAAGKAFRHGCETFPENPRFIFGQAKWLRQTGNPQAALAFLEHASFPPDAERDAEREKAAARAAIETAAAAQGQEFRKAHLAQSDTARQQGDFRTSRRHLRRLIAAQPADHIPWTRLADDFLSEEKPRGALLVLRKGLQSGIQSNALALKTANVMIALDRPERAESILVSLVTHEPDYAQAWKAYIDAALKRGDFAEARLRLSAALDLHPEDWSLLTRKLRIAVAEEHFKEALDLARALRERFPKRPEVAIAVAESCMRMSLWDEAGATLDAAILINPGSTVLLRNAMRIFRAQARFDRADAAAAELLKIWPGSGEVLLERAEIALCAGEPAGATRFLEAQDVQGSGKMVFRRAWLQAIAQELAGDTKGAIQSLNGYPDQTAFRARIQEKLAIFALNALDLDAARLHLRQAFASKLGLNDTDASEVKFRRGQIGHILNDYLLDRKPIEAARKRLKGMKSVRSTLAFIDPDRPALWAASTVVHRLKLFAARQPGKTGGKGDEPLIPRHIIIHMPDAEKSAEAQARLERWRRCNAGYRFAMVDDAGASAFVQKHYGEIVGQAFNAMTDIPAKADLFLLMALASVGGFAVNRRLACSGAIAEIIDHKASLVVAEDLLGLPGNAFVGAAPGHPAILQALGIGMKASFSAVSMNNWIETGPGAIVMGIAGWLAMEPKQVEKSRASIQGLSRQQLYAVAVPRERWPF